MKKIFILINLFVTLISFTSMGQSTDNVQDSKSDNFGLSALMGYNFNGKGDWSNINPEIFLGWTENIIGTDNSKLVWKLRVGPTVSTIKNTKDTLDYFRSVMLPGNGSFSFMTFAIYQPKDFKIILSTAAGIKALSGFSDSTTAISQINVRMGLGFQFKKLLALSAQYTWGRHDFISQSEQTYKSLFQQDNTNVKYVTITLQSFLPSMELYFYSTYRQFLTDINIPGLNNKKIVTIGVRKDIDLIASFPPK
jgi:hypothetical protein